MNNPPLVSIVIPSYNHAQFVQETIQSVIDQDYENIELIIIDDGSKDNSVEVIQKMVPACEARFKRFEFRYRPNKGLCATLNEALEWCQGKYYAPIASDDVLLPHKSRVQVEFLEQNKECVAVGGKAQAISETGEELGRIHGTIGKFYFKEVFLHQGFLAAPTAMIRARNIINVDGYDESIKIEDWLMWLKLTESGNYLETLDEIFCFYRKHDNNISKNYQLMASERMKIIELFSKHPLKSQALKAVNKINNKESILSKYGLNVSDEEELKAYLKNNTNAIVYGGGAYLENITKYLPREKIYEILYTQGDDIASETTNLIVDINNYQSILICSSFYDEIIQTIKTKASSAVEIKVAYF